jgi:sulfur-oxidizing protein SoxY
VDRAAFDAASLNDALNALGAVAPADNASIKLTAPEIAENGTSVPVTVECQFSGTEQIAILVEKNPTMLAASFAIPEGTEGFVSTKIKMAQTSAVIALVKANGKFYRVARDVKVTAGGC